MSAHTPGPWEDGTLPGQKVFAGHMTICDIRGWGYLTGIGGLSLPEEEAIKIQIANARLIAAAPELLEALKRCAALCEPHSAAQEAKSVIAKAEGRA